MSRIYQISATAELGLYLCNIQGVEYTPENVVRLLREVGWNAPVTAPDDPAFPNWPRTKQAEWMMSPLVKPEPDDPEARRIVERAKDARRVVRVWHEGSVAKAIVECKMGDRVSFGVNTLTGDNVRWW